MNNRIDLMIAGAQKAGTTSAKSYLGQHKDIVTHLQTECSFFIRDEEYENGEEYLFKTYFSEAKSNSAVRVVAKSAAIYNNEAALQRLSQHNPDCLILFIVRHPVDRAYSSYLMEVNSGWYNKKWETVTTSIQKYNEGEKDQMFRLFVELGIYAEQLKKIYKYFPKEQVMIVLFEDLIGQPDMVCKSIFSKLGIDDQFKVDTTVHHNPSKQPRSKHVAKGITWLRFDHNPFKKIMKWLLPHALFIRLGNWLIAAGSVTKEHPAMNVATRKLLLDFFKPYNREFSKMTGFDVSKWDV